MLGQGGEGPQNAKHLRTSYICPLPSQMKSMESMEPLELAVMELLTLTFTDGALFPGGGVPEEYLESFNTYHTCGVQWIDANALWYREVHLVT